MKTINKMKIKKGSLITFNNRTFDYRSFTTPKEAIVRNVRTDNFGVSWFMVKVSGIFYLAHTPENNVEYIQK